MADEIKPIPTSDIAWAGSGTKTTPSPAKRASGWLFQESPPFDFFNWLDGEQSEWIQWLESVSTRYFETLGGAIDALDVGATFCLQPAIAESFTTLFGVFTGSTNPRGIATDGLRAYVWDADDDELTATQMFDASTEWVASPTVTGEAERITTDGEIVAAAFPYDAGTSEIIIWEASSGSPLAQINVAITASVNQIYAGSENNERLLYYCDGDSVKQWSSSTGITTLYTYAAGQTVKALCRTAEYILVLRNSGATTQLQALLPNGTLAASDIQLSAAACGSASVVSDGRHAYVALYFGAADMELHKTEIFGNLLAGPNNLWGGVLTNGGFGPPSFYCLEVDDRYLYTILPDGNIAAVFCKDSGALRYADSANQAYGAATDGWRFYLTRAGASSTIFARGTGRGSSMWTTTTPLAVPGNVDTGNLIEPFRKFAVPLSKG